MNQHLSEKLLNPASYSGSEVDARIVLSRELLNLFLKDFDHKQVNTVYLHAITKDSIIIRLTTTILLHKDLTVSLTIDPVIDLDGLIVKAQITGGLNKLQRMAISALTNENIKVEGKEITVRLAHYLGEEVISSAYFKLIRSLKLLPDHDSIITQIKLKAD